MDLLFVLLIALWTTGGFAGLSNADSLPIAASYADSDGGYSSRKPEMGTTTGFPDDICMDRTDYLPMYRFHLKSCTMCYTYLFLYTKDLVGVPPKYEFLMYQNQSLSKFTGPIYPDPDNETAMDQVCSTLHDVDCRRWRDCCSAAVMCCEKQRSTPYATSYNKLCSRTWDGYSCWDDTLAGTTVSTSCPSFMDDAMGNRRAFKMCTENATWETNRGVEWTDYRPCVDLEGILINVYICVGCNSASMLLVVPSIVIFLVFKDLAKQHRIRLHINFFLALLLRSIAVILWYLLVHYEKVTNADTDDAVMIRNPMWCRVLSFFKIYLNSTTYAWMFCEGYYLHRLISRAFEPPKSLITLYLFGWGVPAIPAVVYSILRVVYDNTSCWIHNLGHMEWVLYGPNLVCITLNIIFLCNILRILMFQLHSHPHEPSNFRRGLKAGFMLIPLFGVQLILTIYRPSDNLAGNYKAYEYTTTIIINSQGVFVALIFCFFNGEVLGHFYDRYSTCKCCLKHLVRPRIQSNPMTQVTFADDRRSPSNSLHSHSSISPKRNGRFSVNGTGKDFDLQEIVHSKNSSNSSLAKTFNGSTPACKSGYSALPTTPDQNT